MEHELKILPGYYCRIEDGTKTFEIRNNDRGFQAGDTVKLREWDPTMVIKKIDHDLHPQEEPFGYTGKSLRFKIGYVLPVDAERVAFSLLEIKKSDPALKCPLHGEKGCMCG